MNHVRVGVLFDQLRGLPSVWLQINYSREEPLQ